MTFNKRRAPPLRALMPKKGLVPGTGDDPVTSCFSDTRAMTLDQLSIALLCRKPLFHMFDNAGL